MKSINITERNFKKLEKLELPKEVLSTESELYFYDFRGERKLIKRLYRTNGEYFATKLYTVAMLDEYRENLPDNLVLPDYTLSINQENVGFTVPYVKGVPLSVILKNPKIDSKEKIEYLKEVGYIIRKLENIRKYNESIEIFLNDINESNFIVNPSNRELYVIDLDSVKIENNKIFPSRYLSKDGLLSNIPEKYKKNESAWIRASNKDDDYKYKNKLVEGFYIPNNNTDLYCYHILILNYLYGENINNLSLEEYYEYLNYLLYIEVDKELVDKFYDIVNTCDNKNPTDFLDSLTHENIGRANKKVYDLNKGKNF